MDEGLLRIVYQRLADNGLPSEDAQLFVIAACQGPSELQQVLGGARPAARPGEAPPPTTTRRFPTEVEFTVTENAKTLKFKAQGFEKD